MTIKYNTIGINYNNSRQSDAYLTNRMMHHLKPPANGRFLDIGCGTGNYTIELRNRHYSCIGIDPSVEMLKTAQSKNQDIDWIIGTAEYTDLPSESIDGIIAHLTIHHWSDLKAGIKEQFRILKPGGRIVIFSSSPEQMKGYWLNCYFPKMMHDSIVQMPSKDLVLGALNQSGFTATRTEKYFVKSDLQDKFLYCGKHNPELYLDISIRHGISSFASLSQKSEIEKGLLQLSQDISTGKIHDVKRSCENESGDYLFIYAQKPGYQ